MGKFWGDYKGGVGKSGVLEHKSGNISETRKDRGQVTMEGLGSHKRSFDTASKIGGSQPHRKNCNRYYLTAGTAKAIHHCKFGRYIHTVHANTSPLKILEKRERGRIQGLPKFFEYPLLSQEGVKLRTSNLARLFIGPWEQKPLKIGQKRERDRIQGLPKFF